MWKKCYGAVIEMDAERFPDGNTTSQASFFRVVNLFKNKNKKKNNRKLKATKKLKQAKITKLELELIQKTCDTIIK